MVPNRFSSRGLRLMDRWTFQVKVPRMRPGPADGSDQYEVVHQEAVVEVWGPP